MTPREVALTIYGAQQRRDRDLHDLAWQTHLLLSAWVKDAPSIPRLLGYEGTERDPRFVPQEIYEEAKRQALEEGASVLSPLAEPLRDAS